jgi:Flp pilus assembly protein TadG
VLQRQLKSNRKQAGSAALEAMLLIPIIAVILTLLVNMGYNGVRHRKAQAALRLGAFEFVDGLTTTTRDKAQQAAQGSVSNKMFNGESNPLTLAVSGSNNPPAGMPDDKGILGNISFRQTVSVTVTRDPPYDILPATPINGSLTLSANTFTYCEMQDEDFGGASTAMGGFSLVSGYALWLFGGCGNAGSGIGGLGACTNRCDAP